MATEEKDSTDAMLVSEAGLLVSGVDRTLGCMFGSAGGPVRPDGARTVAFLGSWRPLLVMSPSLRDLADQPTARACVVPNGSQARAGLRPFS